MEKNKNSGWKKKLSEREERKILKEAGNSTKSCTQLASCVATKICKTTVWNILNKSKHIVRQKLKPMPRLLKRHITARLEFCQKNMNKNWSNVIFSDEKKFNLDGPDGCNAYWRDLRKEPQYFSKRNFGGGSLMIWGAFEVDGCLELQLVTTKMNSKMYCDMLQCSLLSFLNQNNIKTYEFQHDNAAVHASKYTKDWLAENKVEILDWPACSPDLNPIENIWGILARRIYADNRQYASVAELKIEVIKQWGDLDKQLLKNLINSMPNRFFECIKNKGGITHY